MRILVWLFRAFVFFSLFAFSLNNQQTASVHWFFGYAWTAPMVIIVLVAFGAGTAFGVLAMAPSWWRQRRLARQSAPAAAPTPAAPATPPVAPDTTPPIPDGV
ncbi:MAG TPA: LapA family protein [Ideonella sp.]|nr:LapA family protein [Ideonella sp.]